MIIVDTSALLAYLWASDPGHQRVAALFEAEPGPFIVSPYVVAELDYLLLAKGGVRAQLVALGELASGAYELPIMGAADLIMCAEVVGRFADQSIGVTDASLVILAERYATTKIATFDHRHFSVLRSLTGESFTLLPA